MGATCVRKKSGVKGKQKEDKQADKQTDRQNIIENLIDKFTPVVVENEAKIRKDEQIPLPELV